MDCPSRTTGGDEGDDMTTTARHARGARRRARLTVYREAVRRAAGIDAPTARARDAWIEACRMLAKAWPAVAREHVADVKAGRWSINDPAEGRST